MRFYSQTTLEIMEGRLLELTNMDYSELSEKEKVGRMIERGLLGTILNTSTHKFLQYQQN